MMRSLLRPQTGAEDNFQKGIDPSS